MAERKELAAAIGEKTFEEDGRIKITCASALSIARDHGVQPAEVGTICNEENIRVCCCQLGCFR